MKKNKSEKELESEFQSSLIKDLRTLYGEFNVNKMPPSIYQGIADIEVTCGPKFARLECKAFSSASHQPNQDYHVDRTNKDGAFARFIYPENKDEVLEELRDYFNK